ncbi:MULTISPECIES: efflux RND transporter periplasmic adaptor subunit [Rhodopirellula]|uniref:efflux RND transporter periplasmic adaptor subunit n=1 Tax=Rhodopirellula TaxID=265488 RepID=UPI00258008EE|nr:HlyD family efflux transporter periplasmic adaptor subunit [Rhodopirellula sp. UBA1907]|tara:strand:+ start:376 stop:1824 length:1449 start_codon:yes stop_codon:yes gene_type:complete
MVSTAASTDFASQAKPKRVVASNATNAQTMQSAELSDISRSKLFQSMWHTWLTEMASTKDRVSAAELLVQRLCTVLPEHTIRLGWGGRTLHRLHDGRLGWLGADNSIRQRYDAQWLASTAEDSPPPTESTSRWDNGTLVIDLVPDVENASHPSENASGGSTSPRCQLWIRPPAADDFDARTFQRMLTPDVMGLFAAIFLSRPAKDHWGRLANKLSKWWSRRGLIGIAFLVTLILTCIPMSYRTHAIATVAPMNGRLIASPIDATLLTTLVRPGDRVTEGQTLLQLDGRPLRIELESLLAEIDEAQKDEDIALASNQIASAQLAGLRRKTLLRKAELLQDKLSKLDVVSPIDGIIIQGDLTRSLGTPLEIGQTLMEVAPEGNVEIELELPESEIGFVEMNAPVELWFPALDAVAFESSVQSVWPAATIRDDANVFVAIAELPNENAALRVGMRGEAIVMGPTYPWIWKWIRTPVRRMGWMIGW